MTQPRFIRIPRTDGRTATIRTDMITALLPNKVKDQEQVMIQLGPTVTIHTTLTEAEIVKAVRDATGENWIIEEVQAA